MSHEYGWSEQQPPPEPRSSHPPQRASGPIIEERLHPLSPLVSLWLGVVALGWYAATSFIQGDPIWQDVDRFRTWLTEVPWWVFVAGGAVVLGLGFGYWSWWTTKFVIDDREFRLENLGAFQESRRIAFGRIQSVDVTQPFAARLLGLAQVRIDVGAEGGASLKYLTRKRAVEIRDHLMVRAHGPAASTAEPGRTASAWDDSAQGDQVLVRLTPGEIILSAFATLDMPFIMLGFLMPLVLGSIFDWNVLAWGGGLVGMGVALLGYLSHRLFGQFNYTLARTPTGLRITRGLLTLRSQTIPTHRVQAVTTNQPFPWRFLDRARLDITILGGPGDESDPTASMIYLPFGTPAQVQVALAALWPGLELERLRFTRTPARARWLDPLQWTWQGYAWDDQVLVGRAGWLHRRQFIVPHARLQAVTISQGPLERRLGLAGVRAETTHALSLTHIRHLDGAQARALAFTEMDRVRTSRMHALLHPPGAREASVSAAGIGVVPGGVPDVWTPPTAPLPTALPTSPGTTPGDSPD